MPPRQHGVKLGTIPNWSPTVDFVTTDEFSTWNQATSAKGNKMIPWKDRQPNSFSGPDRIFATSGRGVTGAVTEYRYGVRADVGLDIDCKIPLRQSWIFPADLANPHLGFHVLLSMLDRSTVFGLSESLGEDDTLDLETAPYDLSSRTIAAARVSEDMIVQVTENYLVSISSTHRCVCLLRGEDDCCVGWSIGWSIRSEGG